MLQLILCGGGQAGTNVTSRAGGQVARERGDERQDEGEHEPKEGGRPGRRSECET